VPAFGRFFSVGSLFVVITASLSGQAGPPAAGTTPPGTSQQAPPPATKLEGFTPAGGSVVTLGYDDLGRVGGISVDVREMRDAKGTDARGLLVQVTESQYRSERSFVDADEIPELLKGIDALIGVKANPTSFKNFEVRYTTRGSLQLTAFNMASGKIQYAVQTGRIGKAQIVGIDDAGMVRLRGLFEAALQKLSAAAK
jgi:hypothetical protein